MRLEMLQPSRSTYDLKHFADSESGKPSSSLTAEKKRML
jgi:hypothetical protein